MLDETVTREEALIAHTRSNAYLFFQEDSLGSLEVGKQADLVVLDRDYLTVPAAEIKDIRADVDDGRRARRVPRSAVVSISRPSAWCAAALDYRLVLR